MASVYMNGLPSEPRPTIAPRLHLLAYASFLVLAGAFLISELWIAGRVGPSIDDGWIYLAFSRSLAAGEGFTLPAMDSPVTPITSPVWQWFLSLGFLVAGASVWVAKLVGVGAGVLAVWGVHRMGRAATGDAVQAGILALLFAVTGRFLWGSLSGMDVPVQVATVTHGIALHLDRRRSPTARWWPAALVLALSGWARPECFVFPVLAALDRRRWKDFAIVGLLIAAFPLYHLAIYGHALPTPFYVKALDASPLTILRADGSMPAAIALGSGVIEQVVSTTVNAASYLPLLVPALLLGVVRGRRERNGVPLIAAALSLFVIARASVGGGNPWLQMSRTYAFVWPMFALVCLHGLDLRRRSSWWSAVILLALAALWWLAPWRTPMLLFGWLDRDAPAGVDLMSPWNTWLPFLAIVSVAGAAFLIHRRAGTIGRPPLWATVPFLALATGLAGELHGRNVRDTYELDVAMAEKVREIVPAGETVACYDLGAMGWFANRPLLDMGGLGSVEVTFRPRSPDGSRDIPGLIAERRIRWMAATGAMLDLVNPSGATPPGLRGARVAHEITLDANVTVCGAHYTLLELIWE